MIKFSTNNKKTVKEIYVSELSTAFVPVICELEEITEPKTCPCLFEVRRLLFLHIIDEKVILILSCNFYRLFALSGKTDSKYFVYPIIFVYVRVLQLYKEPSFVCRLH